MHSHSHTYTHGVGTGGRESNRPATINVPLLEGIRDAPYVATFRSVLARVLSATTPDAICMAVGADALAMDPHGGFNVTEAGLSACLGMVLDASLPLLLLGGGTRAGDRAPCLTRRVDAVVL